MLVAKNTGLRWGIVGVGDVCEVKSGPAFNKIEGSELVAVMRRSADLAKDYAERHKVPKWYNDADKLINDPDINAIYIATPPNVHLEYTKKVAAAGKIVYVEKPMARTYAECLEMVDVCNQANVPLFVAYYRRSLPNFLKIKEIIENGIIGDIRFVQVMVHKTQQPDIVGASGSATNWRTNPEIAGGGYFYDLACHQLDFLDFLFGPIISAKGLAKNQAGIYLAEDIVVGNFEFQSGVMGTGSWCFSTSSQSTIENTTIIGSKGQIRFPFFGDHSVTLEVDGKAKEILHFDIPVNIQQAFIQSIVNELNGLGSCPSHGVSASRTNKVMEEICGKTD